jgi:nucleotide-binding universal stress UspA family protein
LSGLGLRQAFALGCGMNARGSTEVVVATIGLTTGALTHNLYTLIVTMAVITTMAMPPMLRWALARVPMDPEEQQRLEHEELEAKGFVSKFERLLVAADESASGKLASRLAGVISGQRGLPMTVLDISLRARPDTTSDAETTDDAKAIVDADDRGETGRSPTAHAIESADIAGAAVEGQDSNARPRRAEIIARIETKDTTDAIAQEAAKGFDVLIVGVDRMRDPHGGFSEDVNRIVSTFEGPVALVIARHRDSGGASGPERNVLVPFSGTEVSRRGAELAFALTSPETTTVTAVHISRRKAARGKRAPPDAASSQAEAAVLDDATKLGAHYGFKVATAIHLDDAPEDAILREAARVEADLLVIGAARRVGEALYLGKTVAALMERWTGDLVVLAI